MKRIFDYVRNNFLELVITLLIFTNLFPLYFPGFLYYVGLALMLYKMFKCHVKWKARNSIGLVLVLIAFWSSLFNGFLDVRLLVFILVLYLSYPMVTSLRWHLFKKKLLKNFFLGYAIVTIASLIAKLLGVNNRLLKWSEDEIDLSAVHEFSGFASHPMWVSCAAALCALYFVYLVLNAKTTSKLVKLSYGIMIVISAYIIVISASRSALALTLGCTLLMLKWSSKHFGKMLKYTAIFVVGGILIFPFLQDNMGSMQQKQDYQNETGKTSRDEKWGELMAEFDESPIYGVGFAVHGVGSNKSLGRYETGSGWLAVLGQLGILGFVFTLVMWGKAITPLRLLRRDKWIIMIYCGFIFFTIHSIFEGYMIQCGWYLCLVCWMIVGVLVENKQYYKFIKGNPVY